MHSAEIIVLATRAYLAAGVLAGAVFLTAGIGRIDASARGVYAFRPLLLPGVALLWPLVLWRWRQLAKRAAGGHA